jgi:hypothetical protein
MPKPKLAKKVMVPEHSDSDSDDQVVAIGNKRSAPQDLKKAQVTKQAKGQKPVVVAQEDSDDSSDEGAAPRHVQDSDDDSSSDGEEQPRRSSRISSQAGSRKTSMKQQDGGDDKAAEVFVGNLPWSVKEDGL